MTLTTENRQRAATLIESLGRNISDLMQLLLLGEIEAEGSADVKSPAPKRTTTSAGAAGAAAAASRSSPPTVSSPEHPAAKQSPPQKKPAKKKDPNAPKRNLTSYMLFSQSIRPKIVKEHPELSAIDTAKLIGEKWNALSDKEKEPFLKQATKEKEKFDKAMKVYNDGLNATNESAAVAAPKPAAPKPAAPKPTSAPEKPVESKKAESKKAESKKAESNKVESNKENKQSEKRKHQSSGGSSKKKSKKHSSSSQK